LAKSIIAVVCGTAIAQRKLHPELSLAASHTSILLLLKLAAVV
jgi:hypothetical protein